MSHQNAYRKDAALSRRFAKVTIEEPSVADSIQILQGLKADLPGPPIM